MATGLDAQQQLFSRNPDDGRAFETLEEHFFLEGDWEALCRIYRERLAAPSVERDDDLRGPLLFRLGQILEERLLDLHGATEAYWTLARIDPSNRPALRQLRGIHERRGQWDMVLQIAELESATDMPPYERAAFEAELGRTWQHHLQDPDEAARAFTRALEHDADFPPALEGLAEIHKEAGRLSQAAEILERLTRRLRGPERAPVWITLGGLYAGALENPERARDCFAAALEDDPFQTPAVEWSLLLATAEEDWPAVSELLENRFDLAAGARHRAAIAVEASQIQLNHLDAPASARAWADRALELCADEPSVLLAASDVERRDGDRDTLLQHLDQLIEVLGDRTPRPILVEAAELHADFGHTESALAALERAAGQAGSQDERLLMLQARLLRESGQKRELAEVLETLTALGADAGPGPDPERAARLRELAVLQEEDLADPTAARASWQRAHELEPGNRAGFEALERIYRKDEDWTALRRLLEAAIANASEAPPLEWPIRLGDLLLDRFDDAAGARRLYECAIEIDGDAPAALAGLRRIADETDDPDLLLSLCEREAADCNDAERYAMLAQSVLPILEGREDWQAALDWVTRWTALDPRARAAFERRAALEARLERPEKQAASLRALADLETGAARATALEREAEIHVTLGVEARAIDALEEAHRADASSTPILYALCEQYRNTRRHTDLARTLRSLADALARGERAAVLDELACTLHESLGDLDTAIVVRWQLLDEPDAPPAAAERLEALLESAGRYGELVQLLEDRRRTLDDGSTDAFELDLRRGKLLLDALGHCEEASALFGRLHSERPESEEVADLLERALRSGDDAGALCVFLAERAAAEDDATRRASLLLERARLKEEVLGEPLEACDLYESLLRDEAVDAEIAESAGLRFENLLESTAQWERLRDRLDERADGLPDGEQALLRERIASLCRERLHDPAGCAAQLERVAELSSHRLHVWQQLEELYSRELDRPADWLRVVDAELANEPTREREFTLRVAAARVCLDDARRPTGYDATLGYAHFERVLELDAGHAEACEVLAAHFEQAGRHQEAARVLTARLVAVEGTDDPNLTDLRLRLAALFAGPLEDDDQARPLLEQALASRGPVQSVAEPLAALYERNDAHEAICELARAVVEHNGATPERRVWQLRIARAECAQDHLESAAAAYRAALVDSPGDREIEDALIELYERLGERDRLIDLLEARLDTATPTDQVALRLRLARIYAGTSASPAASGAPDATVRAREALAHLEWILDHERLTGPDDDCAQEAIETALLLKEHVEEPERRVSLLSRALDRDWPADRRADLLEQRARIHADELDDPDLAVQSLREALAFDRDRDETRTELRRQLERLERWPSVLDCLFEQATREAGETRIERLEEAARIATEKINPDAALPWLSRLREERPEDPTLLARLAEVHRRAGRYEAALNALDEQLARSMDEAEQAAIERERAEILERDLRAPARAIHAYQRARALRPDDSSILVELDRLFEQTDRPHERAEILEARIAALPEHAASELRHGLASLFCAELARPELAVPHLETNVATSRGDAAAEMAALGALDAALRACGRLDAWIPVAERELELIASDSDLRESTPDDYTRYLHQELANAYDRLRGDPERALSHLRALRDDARSAEEDAGDRAWRSRLAEQLHDLLRRTGRRVELARALAEAAAEGHADADAWLELARLREDVLLDLPGAREAFGEAARDRDTELEALRGMRRTSERLRDWTACADALERELALEGTLERRERTAIARRLGQVCWHHMSDAARAENAYRSALELDANDLDALRALTEIKRAGDDRAEAIELYERELAILGDTDDETERAHQVWLEIAALLDESGDRSDEAIDAYRAAAELRRLGASDELAYARLLEAIGARDEFCEAFGRWCDREDSPAREADHLELARAELARGETTAALARAERATAIAPESAEAWSLLAALLEQSEQPTRAADAFERAAEHATAEAAASLHVQAANAIASEDLERAHRALRRAIELDPALLDAHLALVPVTNELGQHEETQREAEASLELALGAAEPIADERRLEIAVLGGRAARTCGNGAASRRLFQVALDVDPDHVEALEGVALADFEAEDYAAARAPLERRVELPGENPDLALHSMIIARGFEAEEHFDRAWTRYEEALEVDPNLESAHEGLVRVHERAARPEQAQAALERWSAASTDAKTRAQAAFRAAEHAIASGDRAAALRDLERATENDRLLAEAWLLRCELVAERGAEADTREICDRALGAIEPGPLSARISLRAARLAEIAGDTQTARERYAEAAHWDPRSTEAVLCESRLARMSGDWDEADGVLTRFLAAHPDPTSPTLAHVHLERGRLLAGPLERCDQAIEAYEAALELHPELGVARTALAGLLLNSPDRWREALALHRAILAASPTTPASLRAISQLAERRDQPELVEGVLAVLRALGQASPQECDSAPSAFRFAIHPGPPMAEPEAERLRRLAHQVSSELGSVLTDQTDERPRSPAPEIDEMLAQIVAIEDEISAPGLSRLSPDERSRLFSTLAAMFLDPGGNGPESRFQEPLDAALGRWTRRKARRIVEETTLAAIESVDQQAFGVELRAMAAAQVIDRNGGDLRSALRALLVLEDACPAENDFKGSELGPLAAECEPARRLLARITTLLCDRLEQRG